MDARALQSSAVRLVRKQKLEQIMSWLNRIDFSSRIDAAVFSAELFLICLFSFRETRPALFTSSIIPSNSVPRCRSSNTSERTRNERNGNRINNRLATMKIGSGPTGIDYFPLGPRISDALLALRSRCAHVALAPTRFSGASSGLCTHLDESIAILTVQTSGRQPRSRETLFSFR